MNLALFFLANIGAIAFFVVAFRAFRSFDMMLRRIYESDHERWTKLGRPIGYFWRPSEKTSFFSSCQSRDALFFKFLAKGCKEPSKQG